MNLAKKVLVVSVVVDDLGRIQTAIGHDKANLMLEIIGNKIQFVFQTSVYHSRSNVMSILIDKKLEAIAPQLKEIESFIEETIVIAQFSVVMKSHIDIIDTGFFKDSCDEIYEMMNYMADHHQDLSDSRVHILDNAMVNEKARYTTIENLLHAAIENDGFQVVYQPIFDVKAEKFHSAEALVRLKDTTTVGFIPPDEFILIAEKKGMIMDLGRIVFENVINMLLELNVKIVAEGVETKEMTDYLSEHAITYLQGYYFSRPLAAADFLNFINEKNA